MLNRISNKVKKYGGKLLWFDPNLTENVPVNLSELTISVDLEVTSKSRSIINPSTVVNTGTQTSYTVNFFEGSLNQGANKNQFFRTLSTNYTEIQHLENDLGDNYEALGIESIDITFNTSYAPTVKIKFIDIRGAAMFSNGGKGKYKFFFEMPYPLFNLTVKGYYGKTVNYCLHLLRFNASFNSQTGNFEIDCEFIGFTYALLADMLMGLVRASVTTTRGQIVFNSIKSEYKNKDSIVTIDELIQKISDIQEAVTKVKQGDKGKQIALSSALKLAIDDIKLKITTYLDNYAIGLTRFTRSSSDGILVCSVPNTTQQTTISNLYATYSTEVKAIVNNQIKKSSTGGLIDFNQSGSDTNIQTIKDELGPDPDTSPKLVGYSKIDSLDVSIIQNQTKLRQELTNAGFNSDKTTYLLYLLPTINYGTTTHVRVVDFSSAIKACDNSQTAADNINSKAVNDATSSLKASIKDVIGFDPTIRNLFRVLCISTEVFLQCMLDVSKEADNDVGGRRAKALNGLRNGLNVSNGANGTTKVYPWPEYREKDPQKGGEYEEWMGNKIPTTNVPELLFTEELLEQMILQYKQDKIRENENNGQLGWWPISVLDVPVQNGLTAKNELNPYRVGLMDELPDVVTPKSSGHSALRVLMYRIFLLFGVANRNGISTNLANIHAKLEAENLYNALINMPDVSIAKTIKSVITGLNGTDVYDLFKDGTTLEVTGEKIPFFTEDGSDVVYNYIVHKPYNSNRSYIPVNGGFDGQAFKTTTSGELKSASEIFSLRNKKNMLFAGNHSNHTRIVDGSNGFSSGNIPGNVDDLTGVSPSVKRWNRLVNDGAVNMKIISYDSYINNAPARPDFGSDVISSINGNNLITHATIDASIVSLGNTSQYVNPITYGKYNANTYDKINYASGANYSKFSLDNVTNQNGTDAGGIASSFIAFFNEGDGNTKKSRNGNPIKIYTLTELAYNGFATSHDPNLRFYGWHDYNDLGNVEDNNGVKNDWFRADNQLVKTDNRFWVNNLERNPYENYGKNRQVIATALQTNAIFVPKIEFFVDDDFSYSLFGSRFYYLQNSKTNIVLSRDSNGVPIKKITLGNASRALLFLHCFPFQGVNKKGISSTAVNVNFTSNHDIWDRFMFDFNNKDIDETMVSGNVNPASEVLGIKGLFRLHNAFIEAPKIWTLFIGAMLWRMEYSVDHGGDPIEFWEYGTGPSTNSDEKEKRKENRKNAIIPNMSLAPRVDQFLSVTLEDEYRVCGMNFYSWPKTDFPYDYTNSKENFGVYSKIDETLIGLPSQIKAEFINQFKEWVYSSFPEIQKDLEIQFEESATNSAYYLNKGGSTGARDKDSYERKWERLNDEYKSYPGAVNATTQYGLAPLALKVSDIKSILGNNIYENYIMVAPISNKQGHISFGDKTPLTSGVIGRYINNQYAYNMELKPTGNAMSKISNLLLEKVYIQNVRPDAWNPPNLRETANDKGKKRPCFTPISFKKNLLTAFLDTFLNHFKTISADLEKAAEDEEDRIQQEMFKSMDDDKIKLNIYRTLMAIYQKWISNIKGEMFAQCSVNERDRDIANNERNVTSGKPSTRLIDSFRFLDRSFNDIGDVFYINPQIFQNMILENRNASFFDIANKILSDNNFNFIPLPTFVNFNDVNVLSDIFEPYPYNDTVLTGPSFVCVYAGQSSTDLDLGQDSDYPDDGIFILTDDKGDLVVSTIPDDMVNAKAPTVYETNLPIFSVNYGQQNQNYFNNIKLDQSEFSETAESLEIMDDIAQGGDKRKSVMVGQNLFNVYQKRSYSCEVEMLGCALIQPMMYFQLNNIPMFRGLYLIINVSHSIKPNSMTTTFTGVRVKKTKTPLLTASDVLMTLVGDVSNVNVGSTTINTSIPSGNQNYRAVVQNDATFLARVKEVANSINADFTHLLAIMEIESGFKPDICNSGNFCGLIQLSVANRRTYVTGNTDAQRKTNLISMTRTEQMDIVEKYFLNGKNGTGPIKPSELYLIVFLPAYVSKPEDYVIATAIDDPNLYWEKNPGLHDNSRTNKDIWKGYLGQLVEAKAVKYQGL